MVRRAPIQKREMEKPTLFDLLPSWESKVKYTPEDGRPQTERIVSTKANMLQISGAEEGGYWVMRLTDPLNETHFDGGILWPVRLDPLGKFALRAHESIAKFMGTEDSVALETLARTIPDLFLRVQDGTIS